MSKMLILFWDYLLKNNIVLSSFIGVLLIIVESSKLRSAFKEALVLSGAALFSLVSAWLFSYFTAANSEFLLYSVYFLNSLIAIYFIKQAGLLQNKWIANLNKEIIALPALLGIQFKMTETAVYNYQDLIFITAAAAGIYLIYLIIAAVKEQLQLKETKDFFQKEYTLFLVLAFLSAVMAGFNF
jgi:Na+-translocating ferredoxin:NAD+ oxidoreductase RnfA subunit